MKKDKKSKKSIEKAIKKDIEKSVKKGVKKGIKLSLKNSFTFAIALIIIVVAVIWYYVQKKETTVIYSALNEIFAGTSASDDGKLNVHFIDVGQGDCIFVEFPDGKNMLIDSGDRGNGDTITTYLNNLGVTDITLLIATHTDADHIGSMQAVFDEYKVNYCLRPFVYYNGENASDFEQSFNLSSTKSGSYKCGTKTYHTFLSCILNEGCGYSYFNKDSDFTQLVGYNESTYEYKVDFYTPIADVNDISYSDANDYSPIFVLTYGEFSIMFTGDAGKKGEDELLNGYSKIPQIDVLKVGHHGSDTSTTQRFVDRIEPIHSVFMCGTGNKYGHPTQEVITRLYANKYSKIWRTDLQGNIVVTVEAGGEYSFAVEKKASITDLITGIEKQE